jgi:hydroxymethylglutaryl-CoA lyase
MLNPIGKTEWVECPRDAMQGIHRFIHTRDKIRYLNALLQVGFDVLDFGSFVSAKAIPQLRDTAEVLEGIHKAEGTRLLAIVANKRGGETACTFNTIDCIGFPLSVSETFQQRNTNASIQQALQTVNDLIELTSANNKELVVYISMAFGNPYGDDWSVEGVGDMAHTLRQMGVKTIALADTVGLADAITVQQLFTSVISGLPDVKIGAHLHVRGDNWREKVEAAWQAGCRRFDSAMKGFGGCPMANDELVGNLAAEHLLAFLQEKKEPLNINPAAFQAALKEADLVFSSPAAI